jgi:pimeloyl-ACP methyl ester carboxylesterase
VIKHHTIETGSADLSVADSRADGPPVLFIHGNSSCKEIFSKQFSEPIGARYRLLAADLPGHGASGRARGDFRQAYAIPGIAGAMAELLQTLGAEDAVIVGWSLGGHIAIEMMVHLPRLRGLLLSGTPPVPKNLEALAEAFLPNPAMGLAAKADLTKEEVRAYCSAVYGENAEAFQLDAVDPTDGRAREAVFAGFFSGIGVDQQATVEGLDKPVAIINGRNEPLVNNAFLEKLNYRNLWDGNIHLLEHGGHVPFWHTPEQFNALLVRFLSTAHRSD